MATPHVAATVAAPVANNGVGASSWALIDGSGTATEGDSRMLAYLDSRRIGLSGARRFSPARQRSFNSRFSRAANFDGGSPTAVQKLINPRYKAAGVTDLTTEYFVAGCKFRPSKTAHTKIYNAIKGANAGEELTWKGELKEANGFFTMRCMVEKAATGASQEKTRCTYVARVDNYVWDTSPTGITAGATSNDPNLMAWFSYPGAAIPITGATPAATVTYDSRNINLGDIKYLEQASDKVTYSNDGSCEGAKISYTTLAGVEAFSEQGQWKTIDSNNLVAGSGGTPILEDGLQYNMRHFLSYNDGDAADKFITASAGGDVSVTPRWMFDEMWVGLGSIMTGTVFNAQLTNHVPFACCKPERMPARSEERYYNKIFRYQSRICATNSPGHVLVPGQTTAGSCNPAMARAGSGNETTSLITADERP